MADFVLTPAQDRAVHCTDKNVAVSAGAGSGKTRVLVQRYLYILGRGIDRPADTVLPRNIVAVTFTRKAAAEMCDRIRKEIEAKLSEGEHCDYWRQQLKGLDRAQIGTMHSLCGSFLRTNPVESNLDPAFTVLEEAEYAEFLEKEVRDRLRSLLHRQDPAAVLLCDEYGSRSLQEQTLFLLQKGIAFTAGELTGKYEEALAAIEKDAEELRSAFTPELAETCSPGNRKVLEGNLAAIRNALSDLTVHANLEYLETINKGLSRRGKNQAEICGIKDRLDSVAAYPLCIKALSLAPAWEQYLLQMREHLSQKRQEAGLLSFDDLEEKALALLEQHPDVLARYRKQFRYIMVDEFQDTNERQRRLVYLLSGGHQEKLRDNRLFIVGDSKQSIYRFRGADVSVFARVRKEILAAGGELISLNDNFRTVDSILQLCNAVFPGLMGEDRSKDVYYEAMQYHRQSDIKPELFVQQYAKDVSPMEARQTEAAWLAERLAQLRQEGVAFGEMAILLQSMTHITLLTDALQQRAVNYAVVDGRGFYEQTEVRDMLNIFAFAVNPNDDLILSGVLRSVYMGVNDAALTRLHMALADYKMKTAAAVSLWEFLLISEYLTEKTEEVFLTRAFSLLCKLPSAAMCLNLPDFCREIRKILHPEAVLALQPNGEEQLANLRKLFRMADELSVQKLTTVQDFVTRLQRLQEKQDREASATVAAEDAVQIMTVHKAKGLEFPLVAVPFLDSQFNKDKTRVAWHPERGLGISVREEGGTIVPGFLLQQIRDLNTEKELEEKARLLYVALTRARDRLILSGSRKESKNGKPSAAKNWLNWLDYGLPKDYAGIGRQEATLETTDASGFLPLSQEPEDFYPETLARLLEQVAPLQMYGGKSMTHFSASSLQEYVFCPRRYYYRVIETIPPLEEREGQGKGLPAAVLGSLVHKALEKYAKRRNGKPEDEGKEGAARHNDIEEEKLWRTCYREAVEEAAGGRFDLAGEAEVLLWDYLRSDLYKNFKDRQKYAEYEFRLPLLEDDDRVYTVSGVIDAVVEREKGKLEIIDYKSGLPPRDDEIPEGYAWQLVLYKMALERLLQLRGESAKVTKASLHYLRDRSERVLPDKDYRKEILQVCGEIAGKKAEPDFAVRTENCACCPFAYMCKKN